MIRVVVTLDLQMRNADSAMRALESTAAMVDFGAAWWLLVCASAEVDHRTVSGDGRCRIESNHEKNEGICFGTACRSKDRWGNHSHPKGRKMAAPFGWVGCSDGGQIRQG